MAAIHGCRISVNGIGNDAGVKRQDIKSCLEVVDYQMVSTKASVVLIRGGVSLTIINTRDASRQLSVYPFSELVHGNIGFGSPAAGSGARIGFNGGCRGNLDIAGTG
jgi:hypothetical protein